MLFKLDELKVRIQLVSPDILIITEIYPKMGKSTDITEEELHIDNYNLFRSNVKESSRGFAIYVKDTLSSTINLDLTDHLFSESVWVNIHINDKDNFLIGGEYRSPQSSIENNDLLLDLLQKTKDTTYTNILIMGDFNLPEINWDLWTTTRSETPISYKFLECLRDKFWEQAIFSPTRWVNVQPGNVLDLCLTDNLEIIKNIEITTRLGNSDHLSIEAELIFPKKVSRSYAEKRNYYKGDYMSANVKLSNINWSCMNEFLSNISQRVVIKGQSLEWTGVSSGVPQGSVLGPLLFILYVNDLPDEVKSYCKLFADGAKLYKDLQNLEDFETIQNDLNKLCQWTIKWLMIFNVEKCKVMHLVKNNPRFEYEMTDKDGNTKVLKLVEMEKDLGVNVQENLKFDKHISLTVNRANRLVGLIKRAFSYLDEETLLVLYKTLIRPILD